MSKAHLTVLELAPAADELWQLECDPKSGFLCHEGQCVTLPDVAAGAKLRPVITATYASGKATNIARVFETFLDPAADTALARLARERLSARLVTFLPGCATPYRVPEIPGAALSRFTPGGAYLACLQARDFGNVEIGLEELPPTGEVQTDRRCANIVSCDGAELINFSPYLLWERACSDRAVDYAARMPSTEVVALAGSLPRVCGGPDRGIYADIIAAIRRTHPGTLVSLDVGGAPVDACLRRGPSASPDLVSVNMDEYAATDADLWRSFGGTVFVHNRRGAWIVSRAGETVDELQERRPDVPVAPGVKPLQTICAGDAAHGGLILGIMLFGRSPDALLKSLVLSQACALTVVESEGGIRALDAALIEGNARRVSPAWAE